MSACRTVPRLGEDRLLPAAFVPKKVWLGMPLWEAQEAFPKEELKTIHPRLVMLSLPSETRSYLNKGKIFYIPMIFFLDKKLLAGTVAIGFMGKSTEYTLEAKEIDQVQIQYVKDCESIYGPNPGVTEHVHLSRVSGQIVWKKPEYKATLTVPRYADPTSLQFLGMLSVMKNAGPKRSADDPSADEMKAILGSIGMPMKQ